MKLLPYFFKSGMMLCLSLMTVQAWGYGGGSVYTQRPNDPEAHYFTGSADGKTDVSDALQTAINQVKTEQAFGILFIPEGTYRISRTIHIPSAVRLIGYGKKRPVFVLAANTPGYQEKQNYMFWFTGGMVQPGREPQDANAGTFYSALSNIDLRIEKGNPQAVGIRAHFAQHSFVSHCNIYIGQGKAGIYDVGNEMDNVCFYGGEYGIDSGRTSPGWPMMLVDSYFEGQRTAAIRSRDVGFAIINMYVKNTPVAFLMQENTSDRLHIENSYFENISTAGIVVNTEDNSFSQLNLQNLDCKNVPVLVSFASGKKTAGLGKQYKVKDYTFGLILKDLTDSGHFNTICLMEPLNKFTPAIVNDVPALPDMSTWVSVRDFGAKGDSETDDTQAFRNAIAKHKVIYVPTGWYRVTETIKMAPGTKLIGLHPFATQLVLKESEPAFSGFGRPTPMLESSEGGDDMLNGVGICTGGYNYRAVGVKWMAGAKSLMNDVKYVGGHGTMRKPTPEQQNRTRQVRNFQRPISSPTNPVAAQGLDLAWDNQYWSLWITNGGGGTFKDIWTANTYASSGMFIDNTSTPGRIYAMSLEHHVRSEARLNNVHNWKIYAFQFEEEGREGPDCHMMEVSNSSHVTFINLWMYRVIRAYIPKEHGINLWNCSDLEFRNLHNYTQVLPVIEVPVYDVNKRLPVYAWDFARLNVSGAEKTNRPYDNRVGAINRLAEGFEFAAGLTADSKGNVYFGENRLRKVYKWDAGKHTLSLLSDYPWKPFSLATDTKDNLLVIFRYDPQPGYLVDGKQETVPKLPDDNPMYSGWGNSGWAAWGYAINPDNPNETIQQLPRVKTSGIVAKKIWVPSSRWRGDFMKVVQATPEYSFVAPDGVTIIPETYDLSRAASLIPVYPGKTKEIFVANENNKTTVRVGVAADGSLGNVQTVYPQGQYSNVVDSDGNLYIADGEIFVYNRAGQEVRRYQLEERPISIVIGGSNKDILFVTTTRSLYAIRIK